MIHTEPIIAVADVLSSLKWYISILNCGHTHAENDVFDQLIDADGNVLLCLHRWGDHAHPSLLNPDNGMIGNGLLIYFRVTDFEAAWERVQTLKLSVESQPQYNPYAQHQEFTLRDLDGYYITICSHRFINT